MKPLSDLISQITDECALKYLREIENGGVYYHRDGCIVDIKLAEQFAESWSREIGLLNHDFQRDKDCAYLKDITHLACQIHNLLYQKDTAYLFVVKDAHLIRFINSVEECVQFFKETKCKELLGEGRQ